MKKVLAAFGLVAACAACCAIPLALPLFGGLFASVGAAAVWGRDTAIFLLAMLAIGVLVWRWRAQRIQAAKASAADGSCGCAKRPAAEHRSTRR